MAFPRSPEELRQTLRVARASSSVPHRVLGGGSNLVVVDEGLDELVVNTRDMRHVDVGRRRRRDRRRRRQPDPHRGALLPRRLARPRERRGHPGLGGRRGGDERRRLRLLDQRRAPGDRGVRRGRGAAASRPRAGASTTAARRSPTARRWRRSRVGLRAGDPAVLGKEIRELQHAAREEPARADATRAASSRTRRGATPEGSSTSSASRGRVAAGAVVSERHANFVVNDAGRAGGRRARAPGPGARARGARGRRGARARGARSGGRRG